MEDGYFGDRHLTILESFWIIICHRSNFNLFFNFLSCNLSMFLLVCILLFFLHSFNVFFFQSICILL
jgi:hypothetical protein